MYCLKVTWPENPPTLVDKPCYATVQECKKHMDSFSDVIASLPTAEQPIIEIVDNNTNKSVIIRAPLTKSSPMPVQQPLIQTKGLLRGVYPD